MHPPPYSAPNGSGTHALPRVRPVPVPCLQRDDALVRRTTGRLQAEQTPAHKDLLNRYASRARALAMFDWQTGRCCPMP
jgi:hypothetical protein